MFLRILGGLGDFEKVVVPLKILNILNTLNTYFLSVKESNKEKLFSFQILSLFCARGRLRRLRVDLRRSAAPSD